MFLVFFNTNGEVLSELSVLLRPVYKNQQQLRNHVGCVHGYLAAVGPVMKVS